MADLKFSLRSDGQLCVKTSKYFGPVEIKPSFPWSEPTRALSIRNLSGEEVGFVGELEELGKDCQNLLKSALSDSSFVFEITDILKISEEYELRSWLIKTKQSQRRFHTRLNEWPRELPQGGYLVCDIFGDHYLLRDPEVLSEKGRKLFSPFVG